MSKWSKFKKRILPVIFWTILIASFIFFAILLHFKANGWQLNFKTWRLIKTGMISLDGSPEQAQVKINGKIYSYNLPAKIGTLPQGYYEVTITSPGYREWRKSIQVLSEKASIYSDIILFLENPQDIPVPKDIAQDFLKVPKTFPDLKISGAEIYWQGRLVTRFTNNILTAVPYEGKKHLIFQDGQEIRVIDIDGSNNHPLFNLSSPEPTILLIKNGGKNIYYLDQGKIFGKTIR